MRLPLAERTASDDILLVDRAVCFNSWPCADVMAGRRKMHAPNVLGANDTRTGRAVFADDLAAKRVDCWQWQLPTFVSVPLYSIRKDVWNK
jgi:hypothetical protein